MRQNKTEHDDRAVVTILVIDDEDILRHFLCEALTLQGCRALAAQDGLTALGIYGKRFREIDFVLTDLLMPGMYGSEVLEEMRLMNPALKAAIMTGYYDLAELTEGLFASVVGVLRKPFTLEQLFALLEKALPAGQRTPCFRAGALETGEKGVLTEHAINPKGINGNQVTRAVFRERESGDEPCGWRLAP